MGEIFIIHAADARDLACKAASQLAAEGASVIRREEGALGRDAVAAAGFADAVVAIWSAASARTPALLEAARRAFARRTLVPVAIGGAAPPGNFSRLWPIDLDGWSGDENDPRWQFVRDEIELARRRAEASPPPRPARGRKRARRVVAARRSPSPSASRRAPEKAPAESGERRFLIRIIPPAAAGLAILSAAAVRLAAPDSAQDTAAVAVRQPAVALREAQSDLDMGEAGAREQGPADFAANDVGESAQTPPAPPLETLEQPPLLADAQPLEREPAGEPPGGPAPADLASAEGEAVFPQDPADQAPDSDAARSDAPMPAAEARDANEAPIDPLTDEAAEARAPLPLPPAPIDDFAGVVFRDCLDCPDMAEIPAGAFSVGADVGDAAFSDDRPARLITIAKPFALSRREITFDDWRRCVEDGGCRAYEPGDAGFGRGKRPVVNVSWEDALAYVAWLSAKTGQPYRLPTEAEWEYAAYAGRAGPPSPDPMLANYEDGARNATAPVASFPPSPFGLYDIYGNVWEWVADCWSDGGPESGSPVQGPCEMRVLKGGAFNSSAWRLRPAHRIAKAQSARESDNGFRVARDLP